MMAEDIIVVSSEVTSSLILTEVHTHDIDTSDAESESVIEFTITILSCPLSS